MAGEEFLQPFLLATLVALGPFLALTVYLARGKGSLWKGFFFGWLGWFLAFVIRVIPVQIPAVLYPGQIEASILVYLLYVGYASAMAGIFEEGFRYFFLRIGKALERGRSYPLSFALGWGLGEAIILFELNIAVIPLVLQPPYPSFADLLPGAFERNLAILAHISFTFIVLRGLASRKAFVGLAAFLHFGLNFATLTFLLLTENVWLTELFLGGLVAALLVGAIYLRPKQDEAGPTVPPAEVRDGNP